jgi:hypothetical protein
MEIRWLGVTKMRGHIYRGKLLGLEVTFIPTYHPAAILRNRGNLEDLKRDLRTAIDELSRIKNVEKEKVTRPLSSKTLLDYINTTQSRKAETHST